MRSFVLAVLLLVAGVWAAEEKLGTRGNPLTIASVDELVEFRQAVMMGTAYKGVALENGAAGLHFKLIKDLDLSSVCGPTVGNWEPIGPFNGSFDGGNHTISNLFMDDSLGNVYNPGFFGPVLLDDSDTSYFENITFDKVKVRTSAVFGTIVSQVVSGHVVIRNNTVNISFQNTSGADFQAGGIVGNSLGEWTGIYHNTVKGSFTIMDFKSIVLGGIIGVAVGAVDLGSNTNEAVIIVKGEGGAYAGGLAGQMLAETVMTGNTNKGNITVQIPQKSAFVGGLVAAYPSSETQRVIKGNSNSGKIVVTASYVAEGGLFGYIMGFKNLTLDSCVNNGDITYRGTGSEELVQVGGVAGIWETSKATRMENHGAISVENAKSPYVGGIVGYVRSGVKDISLAEAVNEGSITIQSNGKVTGWIAGLVGGTDSLKTVTLEKCENKGEIKIVGEKDAGNLVVEPIASVHSGTTLKVEEGSSEEKPGEEKPGDEKPGDQKSGDEKSGDEKSGDQKSGDDKPGDQNPGGGKMVVAVQENLLEMHLFRDGDRLALEIPGLARGERAQVAVFSLEGKRVPVNVTRSGSTFYMDGAIAAGRYIVRAVTSHGSKSFVTIF